MNTEAVLVSPGVSSHEALEALLSSISKQEQLHDHRSLLLYDSYSEQVATHAGLIMTE